MAKKDRKKVGKTTGRRYGFTTKERLIFRYHDGTRDRLGDPLDILRLLKTHPDLDLTIDVKLAISSIPGKEPAEALGRLIDAIRSAFGVAKLDDGGLTATECLALLNDFATYLAGVQRDARPLATSPVSTGFPEASPTPNSSDSPLPSTAA